MIVRDKTAAGGFAEPLTARCGAVQCICTAVAIRIRGAVEGVAERDLLDVPGVRIIEYLGVDVVQHRHAHFLAGLQRLLVETEALHLVEVLAGLFGLYIEGSHAGDRLVR